MILAIDFDGTLAEHDYPEVGREVPGAFEWLRRFQSRGALLILWTMRSHVLSIGIGDIGDIDPLYAAIDFCKERGVEFWGVNANPEQGSWTTSRKAYAHGYIDDAAIGCPLVHPARGRPYVDWSIVGPQVLAAIEAHNR